MILDDGRYAISCVRARAAGEPLPQRRSPCFFDPRHGMSVRDVSWTPPGGTPRDVPACALDAERVEAGAEPATRQVMLGFASVPYWEAGSAYAPWAAGYFATFGLMNVMFFGTMMGAFMVGDGFGGGGSCRWRRRRRFRTVRCRRRFRCRHWQATAARTTTPAGLRRRWVRRGWLRRRRLRRWLGPTVVEGLLVRNDSGSWPCAERPPSIGITVPLTKRAVVGRAGRRRLTATSSGVPTRPSG